MGSAHSATNNGREDACFIGVDKSPPPIPENRTTDLAKTDIGRRVAVSSKGLEKAVGTLQYVGRCGKTTGDIYAGVAFSKPIGTNDGKIDGRRFFRCRERHGVLVLVSLVKLVEANKYLDALRSQAHKDAVTGTSTQVPDGRYMRHQDGHEWGLAGWRKTGLLKFFDFGLDHAILDLFDYCPYYKGNVKGIMPTEVREVNVIGSGNFGEVYLGKLKMRAKKAKGHKIKLDKKGEVDCAVKRCKDGISEMVDIQFAIEAVIHNQFSHHHIVKLYHVTGGPKLGGGPRQIVLEMCEGGDLQSALRKGNFDNRDIHRVLLDVVDGMNYLAEIGFVHRDLAARNVFLKNGQAKVGDFGLSKRIETTSLDQAAVLDGKADDAVGRQRSVREGMLEKATDPAVLPIRWTSPEALLYRDWSQKSDVWSFGVLMYECYTAGATPFLGMQNADVIRFMLDKCILPPPPGCPPEIYALMAKCWRFSAAKRIGFAKLLRSMAKTIKATAKTDALSSEEPLPLVPFKKVIKVSQMQDGSLRMDNFGKPTKPGYFTKVQKEVDFPLLDVQTKHNPLFGMTLTAELVGDDSEEYVAGFEYINYKEAFKPGSVPAKEIDMSNDPLYMYDQPLEGYPVVSREVIFFDTEHSDDLDVDGDVGGEEACSGFGGLDAAAQPERKTSKKAGKPKRPAGAKKDSTKYVNIFEAQPYGTYSNVAVVLDGAVA